MTTEPNGTDLTLPPRESTVFDLRHDAQSLQELVGKLAAFVVDPFVRERLGSEGRDHLEPLVLECAGRASWIAQHADDLGKAEEGRA